MRSSTGFPRVDRKLIEAFDEGSYEIAIGTESAMICDVPDQLCPRHTPASWPCVLGLNIIAGRTHRDEKLGSILYTKSGAAEVPLT